MPLPYLNLHNKVQYFKTDPSPFRVYCGEMFTTERAVTWQTTLYMKFLLILLYCFIFSPLALAIVH